MSKVKSFNGTTMNHTAETDMPMNRRNDKAPLWKYMTMPIMILTCLVVALLLSTIVARTALADQVTLVPDGDIASGSWTASVGPLLSDDTSDGPGGAGGADGTYARITGTTGGFTVSMSNNAAYTGATINSVTVHVRAMVTASGGGNERITFGTSQPSASLSGNTNITRGSFNNYSFVPTGITTDLDVDAIEVDVNAVTLGAGEDMDIAEIWVVVDYTPSVAANELNACDACHTQPPAEGASRNITEGAVVGSHTAHGVYTCTICHPNNAVLNHRGGQGVNGTEGQIDMLANIQGGTYQLGTAFLQDNEDGTGLGTCSDVSCHGGATTTTPQWGSGSLNCDGCHGAPPATNAHAKHYSSKGWGPTDLPGTYCVQCHPDNTGTHSDVTDGIVEVTLTHSGAGASTSCSSWATGCHNSSANTPNWGTTGIACLDCHSIGGTNTATVANPASGLHNETPVVTGVRHNPFDVNFSGCEDCHTATPSSSHWDGTAQTSSPTINFDLPATGFVDGTPPTCTSSCHNDSPTSGPWARKWHADSDLNTGAQCAGCHGDWVNGWNGGVTHRTDTGAGSVRQTHAKGADYECLDCHALGAVDTNTGYVYTAVTNDWGGTSNHGDGSITMNTHGDHTFGRNGSGLSGCLPCHAQYDGIDGAANQHSFTTTNWPLDPVVGEKINAGCDSCHGGGGDYWPLTASTNVADYPDRIGEHDVHMTRIAAELSYTYPYSDAEQKAMCVYCHNDPSGGAGAGGHYPGGYTQTDAPADVGDFNQIWDGADDTTDSYAAGNCTSQCHNAKATASTTSDWYDGAASTCTMCHTVGGGVANEIINPTTGLHDVTPTITGTRHDDSLDASGCVICHTGTPSTAHIDGNPNNSAPIITVAGSSGYSDGSPGTCNSNCHSDSANWARKWHENSTDAVSPTSLVCAGCHGTFTTGFNAGVGIRHQTTTSGDADGDIEANHDGTDKCLTCHAYDGANGYGHDWATHHLDNRIQISDQVSFQVNAGNEVGCAAGCHNVDDGTGDEGHEFEDATTNHGWLARQFVAGPSAGCTGCHSAHGTGSAGVGPNSPHVFRGNKAGYNTFNACEDCHPGNTKGATHELGAGVVAIENNASVGINYSHDVDPGGGVINGFVLGGDATTGNTEAEICWNCHNNATYQTTFISEWGLNTDTNGAGLNYDFGTLTTPNWTTADWSSAVQPDFSYKTAAIQSTHAANAVDGVSGLDAVADIRCSYCHDVHDTADRTGVIATADDPDGAPFLRGNWKGNPYKEDGAPRAGMTYSGTGGNFGSVPRGSTSPSENMGGFWIDQNTTNTPTSMSWTLANSAGLCTICHGTDVDNMNQFGTASADWVGTNGHSNASIGGTGSNKVNIMTLSDRVGTVATYGLYTGAGEFGGAPRMGYGNAGPVGVAISGDGASKQRGYGLRSNDTRGFQLDPRATGGSPYAFEALNWGADIDDAAAQTKYHNFSCSKCHNPHASRLPRLMITNCLDTKQNTWDDGFSTGGAATNSGSSAKSAENINVTFSQATSAQNCHRLNDPAFGISKGSGWNTVTPWGP